MADTYRSRVYTDRPAYADFDAPRKFLAIEGIIARRLKEHPNAVCSYSGGSDSDILIDLIERVRKMFDLPPVAYAFFNTGLEMEATKRHVKETAEKYGVEIKSYRPKMGVVNATRKYGQPFVSKIMSAGLENVQKKNIPLSIADEYAKAEDKHAKRQELREMDGEPVWLHTFLAVQKKTNIAQWAVVEFIGEASVVFVRAGVNSRLSKFLSSYGDTWLAYRHKPKEGA